jgi:glycosyltransferase involved in cell wall biosynthesis
MRKLVVIGPLPPPVHGVAVSTQLVLQNEQLATAFDVVHLDTTDSRPIDNFGRWDAKNVLLGLNALRRLVGHLVRGKGVVYLPLSENSGGFLRDSLFIWLAAIFRWRTAVHIRNSMFVRFYESQPALLRWWIRRTMRAITQVAVLGEVLRPLMDGFVERTRISVVPNGTPEFEMPQCERDRSLVLYLSNISRKKGADIAIKAARLVAAQDDRARFVFAGGWESSAFECEVRELAAPLGERAEFRAPVAGELKTQLMASARVLLFPVAWGEGHPRIVLEALAAGLPIVTTDRATIRETVVDGVSGFVLPDPDPEELASRVLELLHDDVLHASVSAAARARYEERFTQDQADRNLADWLTGVGSTSRPEPVAERSP